MVCNACNRKFRLPLNLFNGQVVCPHCKNELLEINSLQVTKENEELYNLSKIALLRYLSPKSFKEEKSDITRAALLKLAIEYCDHSAKSGNPKAIAQMAYLLEYFPNEHKNQVEAIRLAFGYYAALCYNELVSVPVKEGAKEFSTEEFFELKTSAGRNLLRICATYSALLTGPSYDYKKNKERLNASPVYKAKNMRFADEQVLTGSFNKVAAVHNTIDATRSKTRAPLFGVFKLSATQVKELFSADEGEQNSCFKLIDKSPDFLHYMICDKNGKVRRDEDRYFSRLANIELAEKLCADLKESDYVFFYFFNTSGKHPYLNGKQMQQVKHEIEMDDQALLFSLLSGISDDMAVFFDDDIEMYKNRQSVHGAVERLIDCVREEN